MEAQRRERQLAGLAASHRQLLEMLDELRERRALDAAAPSRLPGWSVGHVLTHLARNADSVTRVLEASERGEIVERYPGGASARDAAIEAGCRRPTDEQVADVRDTIERLDAALRTHTRWDGRSIETYGDTMSVAELLVARWREVEVHRTDLGVGHDIVDWPEEYVLTDLEAMAERWNARLPTGGIGLPPEALAVDPRTRLAWLLGRADIDGLQPAKLL